MKSDFIFSNFQKSRFLPWNLPIQKVHNKRYNNDKIDSDIIFRLYDFIYQVFVILGTIGYHLGTIGYHLKSSKSTWNEQFFFKNTTLIVKTSNDTQWYPESQKHDIWNHTIWKEYQNQFYHCCNVCYELSVMVGFEVKTLIVENLKIWCQISWKCKKNH